MLQEASVGKITDAQHFQ